MARHDWFHPGIYLFLVLAFSLSMVSISDGQRRPVFKFNEFSIEFSRGRFERFLRCLCSAKTSKCQQDYRLINTLYYTAHRNVRSENISANEEAGNTFRCHPGAFTQTGAFIDCVRSADPLVHCENEFFCQPYFVNLDYEGCDSKCINIWWVAREVKITNVAGYPAFDEGSCEPPGSSPSAGNNDGHTTGLIVAAAVGWLFFGLLAGSALAFLYCWRCRKVFRIHRRNQPGQNKTKFVASRNRSLPNSYGDHQPTSKDGRENVNKNNDQKTGYTDYNEANDDYTVIDDEKISGVKKGYAINNEAKPENKRVLPHMPYSTIEPNEISEGNSQTANNGHLPNKITGGEVSQRNKLSTKSADAYSRLQTGRSPADPQMTKSVMLTYNRPSDTVSNNDKSSIDPERPGAVNRSVHPYKLASAVHDELDESASRQ